MSWFIKKNDYALENVVSYGNMFLIGNGHLGYRGTLEEYTKAQLVGLNIVGFYDKYEDKWRESLNSPNPFYVNIENHSVLSNKPLFHEIKLDLKKAMFLRKTEYEDIIIKSERFVSSIEDGNLLMKYSIKFIKDQKLNITIGLDNEIYEINGPHFKEKTISRVGYSLSFKGITNENKTLNVLSKYIFPKEVQSTYKNGLFSLKLEGKANETKTFIVKAKLFENVEIENFKFSSSIYKMDKRKHIEEFLNRWNNAKITIKGDKEAALGIRYSTYHLLILGNKNYKTSIPARGVSGQTYKGAIFWDTEIFLSPFFTFTNPQIARNFIIYRINTLNGALIKAKEYGYDGAFYAWESQESGEEACSKFNVSDPLTNKPIRTYFNEKQIHISADIVYSIHQYILNTNDETILQDGALNLMVEVCKFFISYAKFRDNLYHIDDVIGPDEYHERVNDNAFTNYMVDECFKITLLYLEKYDSSNSIIERFKEFKNNLYLPLPNENGVIEQFEGYFKLEDVNVDIVRSRIKTKNEYWGTKNGVAYPTRVIKQADVIALLSLLDYRFDNDIIKANYQYYYKYTEHGSSLSSSMYSICGYKIDELDVAYNMFLKSSLIDLGTNQKMFAGGIYIGGTHPASAGGAYMGILYGMLGLGRNGKLEFNINLPKKIKEIDMRLIYQNKTYELKAYKDKTYSLKEVY